MIDCRAIGQLMIVIKNKDHGNQEVCVHIQSINELKQPKELVCEECIRQVAIGHIYVPARHVELPYAATSLPTST